MRLQLHELLDVDSTTSGSQPLEHVQHMRHLLDQPHPRLRPPRGFSYTSTFSNSFFRELAGDVPTVPGTGRRTAGAVHPASATPLHRRCLARTTSPRACSAARAGKIRAKSCRNRTRGHERTVYGIEWAAVA